MYGLYMVAIEAGLLGERRAKAVFTAIGIVLAAYTLAVTVYLALKP